MGTVFEFVLSAIIGVALLAAGLFFTAFPGRRYIRVQRYLRRLKRELEPVARAVGARTKTEWVTEKGQVMYFFEFPAEKWDIDNPKGTAISVNAWLTLEVDDTGYNIYVPSFTPPRSLSPDYQTLVNAVTRLQQSGGLP
jgi:hypothetical protein